MKVLWTDQITGITFQVDGLKAKDSSLTTNVPVLHDKETGEQIFDNSKAQWYEWKIFTPMPYGALLVA